MSHHRGFHGRRPIARSEAEPQPELILRQRECQNGSKARVIIFQTQFAAMQVSDRKHERQSQPRSRRAPGLFTTIEPVGRPLPFVRAIPGPSSLTIRQTIEETEALNRTVPPRRRKFHRVIHQVGYRLLNHRLVAVSRHRRRRLDLQDNPAIFRHRAVNIGHLG